MSRDAPFRVLFKVRFVSPVWFMLRGSARPPPARSDFAQQKVLALTASQSAGEPCPLALFDVPLKHEPDRGILFAFE